MKQKWHFNVHDKDEGLPRRLGDGALARIFGGETMTASVIELDPGADSPTHAHPEEQWAVLIEGSAIRTLGTTTATMKPGDFWHTPGNVAHGLTAGPEGAVIVSVFAAPMAGYVTPGAGMDPLGSG
jgi:unsaturated pyranuronate lyase